MEVADQAADADDEERLCIECGRDFPSLNALAAHRMRAHGLRHPFRDRIRGTICPGCARDFGLRDRLLTHIRGLMGCTGVVQPLPLLSPEEVQAEDAAARAQVRANQKAGLYRWAGLLVCLAR